MTDPCGLKPKHHSRIRLNELISWRLLRKNPSGAMIWGILGVAFGINAYYYMHFLRRKEYQVDHKKRMWNERIEMLENPVRLKLYYPNEESIPKPCPQLVEVYKKMKCAEVCKRNELENICKKK